jgi:RNA polymerase sigma-70 factor (ECF subfamily)
VIDLDQHLAAIVAGDAGAFGRWMSGAERPIRDSLRPFARVVDTEAVLQESLLRAWQVAPRIKADGRPNGLLRLTMRMAKNLAVSEVRRARLDLVEPDDLDSKMSESALERTLRPPDPLLRAKIAECRDKLPEKPRLALEERLLNEGGEPDAALAARLGMKTNTFLQNFTRARRMLADCLKSEGVDLELELA